MMKLLDNDGVSYLLTKTKKWVEEDAKAASSKTSDTLGTKTVGDTKTPIYLLNGTPTPLNLNSSANYPHITADNKDVLTSTDGTAAFNVSSNVVEGHTTEDMAIFQINTGLDAWQLSQSSGHLIYRINDNPASAPWPTTFTPLANQEEVYASTAIPNAADLNTYRDAAYWGHTYHSIANNGIKNAPSNVVGNFSLQVSRAADGVTVQVLTCGDFQKMYMRTYNSKDLWSAWAEIGSAFTSLTLEGNITFQGEKNELDYESGDGLFKVLQLYRGNTTGIGIVLQGDGTTYLAAGTAGSLVRDYMIKNNAASGWTDANEELFLCSDNSIYFYPGCQSGVNAAHVNKIDSNGNLILRGNIQFYNNAPHLQYYDETNNKTWNALSLYKVDTNSLGIRIGAGGRVIVGAGESSEALHSKLVNTDKINDSEEILHLAADGPIKLHVNCNDISKQVEVLINTDGSISVNGAAPKLGTKTVGGPTTPVYLNNGVITACTKSI